MLKRFGGIGGIVSFVVAFLVMFFLVQSYMEKRVPLEEDFART